MQAFFIEKLFILKNKILITCLPGLVPYLRTEIEALGYSVRFMDNSGITIEGDWDDIYILNIYLRVASKVLWLIDDFRSNDADELYHAVKKIQWHKLVKKNGYVSIQSFVRNDSINDNRFANLKIKDAISDYFMDIFGCRPDSGPDSHGTCIFLYWVNDKCQLYFDTSGETIAKHGYRENPWKAPMMESLAAACIYATQWDKNQPFVNPMCGSGTLAIEAALMAKNYPPGLFRKNFGFMHILGFDKLKLQKHVMRAKKDIKDTNTPIIATDKHPKAVEVAKENATKAKVLQDIKFDVVPFEKTRLPKNRGIVIINPEYGERLGKIKQLEEVYANIGHYFKQYCKGYNCYVFTGNQQLSRKIGLKPSQKIPFKSGKIDCHLLKYEIYEGSKKSN